MIYLNVFVFVLISFNFKRFPVGPRQARTGGFQTSDSLTRCPEAAGSMMRNKGYERFLLEDSHV
jgi:hypothetical protein